MLDPEIVSIFLEEASDIVKDWEKECLQLEKNIDTPDFNGLFRCAHNIKGSAKSVGLEALGDFVHQIEDVINLLRNQEIQLVPKIVEFLFDAQSILANWLQELTNDIDHIPNTKNMILKADAIKDFASKKKKPQDQEALLQDFGTIAVEEGHATPDKVEEAVKIQNRKLGEVMVDEGIINEEQKVAILDKQKKQKQKIGNHAKVDESIRISASKIDRLIQLIGELSIQQSIIGHAQKTDTLESRHCHNAISLASKLNSEIQATALSLRMLPIEGLFQRLERLIRDLAKNIKKDVEVIIEGSNVELDKTILEKVTDPLIHIVRNAIDHGIESPENRTKNGKPARGEIVISAQQDATGVVISIKDDGKGLDANIIRNKAIEKGLISPNEHLSERDTFMLVFEPGFSTAEKITDISGRGVGMDVVRKAVDSVGGSIEIDSTIGQGSTFAMNLPTSLSIIDALVVKVQEERYIIPLLELSEVLDLNSYKLEVNSFGETMFNLRGKVVPVEPLSDYFPIRNHSPQKDGHKTDSKNHHASQIIDDVPVRPCLIIEMNKSKLAFEIDKIIGQQQVVIKPLNEKLSDLPGYCGGSIMADGEAGMIITLKHLAQKYFNKYSNQPGNLQ